MARLKEISIKYNFFEKYIQEFHFNLRNKPDECVIKGRQAIY